MVTNDPTRTANSSGEAVSGAGLFLSVFAVIALAVGLAELTVGHVSFAAYGGIIAIISFAGSMVCFVVDTRRYETRR
jgi:drug/metabolite transporter superfamily protein YnfA